jgi:hypothetical protein
MQEGENPHALDESFHQRVLVAEDEARATAIERALRVEFDASSILDEEVPRVFGPRWAACIERVRSTLRTLHPKRLNDVFILAARHFEFSRCSGAAFMSSLGGIPVETHGVSESLLAILSTPDGYADYEGWANVVADKLGDIEKPSELLPGTALKNFPNERSLLEADAVTWFFLAADFHASGREQALDVLYEVSEALCFAHGLHMWGEGEKFGQGDASGSSIDPISALASKAANARHAEHRALADQVKAWYAENCSEFRSLDAAAEAAQKIAPLSFRTLRRHIAEAARELRSAGKD